MCRNVYINTYKKIFFLVFSTKKKYEFRWKIYLNEGDRIFNSLKFSIISIIDNLTLKKNTKKRILA